MRIPLILGFIGTLLILSVIGTETPFSTMSATKDFTLTSSSGSIPILLDPSDPEAVHIAAGNFAEDIYRLTGSKPELFHDSLDGRVERAVIVCTSGSKLASRMRSSSHSAQTVLGKKPELESMLQHLDGRSESYEGRVISTPLEGVEEALVLVGSDRVSVMSIQ